MLIGINASAVIKRPRTGVEEYAYQLIKHLTMLPDARAHQFLLYLPTANIRTGENGKNPSQPPFAKGGSAPLLQRGVGGDFDFLLPENFEVKELNWRLPMWTQARLGWEMARRKPEALFIPVHILPLAHPENSVVTIHGLEYEYFPQYYSSRHRLYLRWSTKYALKHARKIIAVSESTKRDLVKLYGADERKIEVVYHGVIRNSLQPPLILRGGEGELSEPYLLYIGRTELKKNLLGILEAYKILKEKYKIPHQLVLAGAPGYGYEIIKLKIDNLLEIRNLKLEIKELGYVSETRKQELLAAAGIFLLPSLCEGFGLPILEAQAARVPVVSSNISSMPEVAGKGALLVNPKNPEEIAGAVYRLIDDSNLRDKLIEAGSENVKRFSWDKCARQTLEVLTEQ